MRPRVLTSMFLGLAVAAGVALPPAFAAPESAPPMQVGLTPIRLAASAVAGPPRFYDYNTAVALSYGVPLGFMLGGGLIGAAVGPALSASPGAATVVMLPIQLAMLGSFASGYVYAGEPLRGALVTLGEFGVLGVAMVVGYGISVLAFGPGQGTGFVAPLVAGPIVLGSLVACEMWKMADLRLVIERKNAGIQ